jgi:hypothetical protein
MLTFSSLRYSALAVTILALAGVTSSRAAPIEIAFDYSTNTPSTVATITGVNGGQISFSLDVGDPNQDSVFGNFEIDIVGPGNATLGSVSLIGAPIVDGPFADLGDAAANPSGGLASVSIWTFLADSSGLPLSLIVTSQLDTFGNPFTPHLTIDLSGDLQIAQVPVPGALVLFGTGLGMLGMVSARRRRTKAR